jgi:hypothetical protein
MEMVGMLLWKESNCQPRELIVQWKIRICQTSNSAICIGIAPASIAQNLESQHLSCGFYLFTQNTTLISGPPFSYRNFSSGLYGTKPRVAPGHVVGVQVNLNAQTVEFFVDDESLGIAYEGIPLSNYPLCPCIIMSTLHDCVEIQTWN